MLDSVSEIVYFCPWVSSTKTKNVQTDELKSIKSVADSMKTSYNIDIAIAPNWASLITVMQDEDLSNLLKNLNDYHVRGI